MVNDWADFKLSEVINLIGGGTPKRSIAEYWGGDIPWLSVKDFNNEYRHVEKSDETITKLGLEKSSTKLLERGQIIISARGTVGELAQVSKTMAFNQSCYGIDAKTEYTLNDFLYYLLKHSISNIQRITHGAVFDTITRDTFNFIEVSLPPLTEQKAIAHILGSLDDKIELNRQMNETLEAMAQALFKSWFVDFDPVIDNALAAGNAIPDELLERAEQRQAIEKKDNSDIQNLFPNAFEFTEEMGWIPKGWGVSKLGEYIEVKRGGSPRPIHDYLVPKGLPWVKISDATASNSRFLVETKQFIKPEGLNKTTLLKKGSLILSNSATPGLPKFLDLDACIHDGWLHFPKKKIFTDNYLYQLFLVVRQELLMQGNGSVFTNLKTDILKNHMVVVPNIDVLNYFDNWINSFHNKIHAVQIDVDNLSRIRDTLLPKLMSGELRISDAAELVEEVV
jgi:type I restriction enzyme S subunit